MLSVQRPINLKQDGIKIRELHVGELFFLHARNIRFYLYCSHIHFFRLPFKNPSDAPWIAITSILLFGKMKFTFALLSGLFVAAVSGLAIPPPDAQTESAALVEREAEPTAATSASDASIIKHAAQGWAIDEDAISVFLDAVASKKFGSQREYLIAAQLAYKAELAALAAFDTLAEYLDGDAGWQSGNSTLSDGGSYGNIESLLYQLTQLNWKTNQAQIQAIVTEINFGSGSYLGRCSSILPAIDVDLAAASAELQLLTGDKSLVGLTVYAPKACSGVKRDVLEG